MEIQSLFYMVNNYFNTCSSIKIEFGSLPALLFSPLFFLFFFFFSRMPSFTHWCMTLNKRPCLQIKEKSELVLATKLMSHHSSKKVKFESHIQLCSRLTCIFHVSCVNFLVSYFFLKFELVFYLQAIL